MSMDKISIVLFLSYVSFHSVYGTITNSTDAIRDLLIPSLFTNVPPYIKFPAANESGRVLPEEIGKHLKWQKPQHYLISEIVRKAGFSITTNPEEATGSWEFPMHAFAPNSTPGSVPHPLNATQKFRHFPGGAYLFSKADLAKVINRASRKFGKDEFNFTPTTFLLPMEKAQFEKAWEQNEDKLWIEKVPATSRGRGLRLIKHPSEVTENRYRVVQKYISDTFTLGGNKSHYIMYAVITSIEPLRLFIRDDVVLTVGLGKYSTDVSTLDNHCVHIPNYATFVPVNCSKGYKMPDRTDAEREELHQEFYTMLSTNNMSKADFMWKVEDILIKSILVSKYFSRYAKKTPFYHSSKYNAFHYMSIDFAIDTKGTPYLLEINHTPTLRTYFGGVRDKGLYRRRSKIISGALTLAGYNLPSTLSTEAKKLVANSLNQRGGKVTYISKLYQFNLTFEEQQKHSEFESIVHSRDAYLEPILQNLTPDDVRHLILAEDELHRSRFYYRIFPARGMSKYLQYVANPYYYMLYDAYEHKYAGDRDAGRRKLSKYTKRSYHFKP